MHAEHDVEVARLDVGVVMREERAAERGQRAGRGDDGQLEAQDVDAERARELRVLAEGADRRAQSSILSSR